MKVLHEGDKIRIQRKGLDDLIHPAPAQPGDFVWVDGEIVASWDKDKLNMERKKVTRDELKRGIRG